MDLTEEELALQARVMESISQKREEVITFKKQSVAKWKNEREQNEDYIEQMRRNKEARKRELEELEVLKASICQEEDEVEFNDVEIEMKNDIPKAPTVQEVEKQQAKQPAKSKEQIEYENELNKLIRPFDPKSMEKESLECKVKELFEIMMKLQNEKQQLKTRLKEQDHEFKDAQERMAERISAKAAKKGVDMEKFYPGAKHPPKMQITSKYDNRKGERTYSDRKDMYNTGIDVVRPKLLEDMWSLKFSAWMDSSTAGKSFDEANESQTL